jgi:ferredoxin
MRTPPPFIERSCSTSYRSGEAPAKAGVATRLTGDPQPEVDPPGGARTNEGPVNLNVSNPLPTDTARLRRLAGSHIEPIAGRCVQCGICSYNCPMGIDVRGHARRGLPVLDSHCLTCGACVARCPRGVLHWAERKEAA